MLMPYLLLASFGFLPTQDDSSLAALEAIQQANLGSFRFFRASFLYTEGSAESLEAAREGRFLVSSTAQGRYASDGKNALYERLHDEAVLLGTARDLGKNRVASSYLSFRHLTDGETTLIDAIKAYPATGEILHGNQIVAGSAAFDTDFAFPLNLGRHIGGYGDLAWVRDAAASGKAKLAGVDESATIEGVTCVEVRHDMREGRRTDWIDPARGGVPLFYRYVKSSGGNKVECAFDDIRQVHGAGWLPFAVTTSLTMGDTVRATHLVVTEFDATRPPDRSTFRIEFAEPTPMIDTARKLNYPARKSWSLLELPRPGQAGVRTVVFADSVPSPPPLPDERIAGRPWGWIILALVAVLVAAIAGRIVWKRSNA